MRILCFGDSNTYGYDPRGFFGGRYAAEDRWVDLLAQKTGHTVINAGASGREIPTASRARMLPEADWLLVMLGTNDLLQGASAAEGTARMEAFLAAQLHCFRKILLVCPPPMKRGAWVPDDELVDRSVRLAEEYQLLAEKLNISFADTRGWNIDLTFDGVHFTEKGHHSFAEYLVEVLP